jgi:adenylate kinase family enzyme
VRETMKIHIIGGPGSGKTYLAEKLSKELGI